MTFSDFICTQVLPDKTSLVSFDVVSSFTKVPIERAKEIAHERLANDTTLDDRTLLSPDEVTKILEPFVVNFTSKHLVLLWARQCWSL